MLTFMRSSAYFNSLYTPQEDENKDSSNFVKSKFNKLGRRILDMLRNYETSENGWDNLREHLERAQRKCSFLWFEAEQVQICDR